MPRKKPKNQKLSKGLSDLFRKGMSKSILPEEEGYGPDAYSKKGTGIARTPDGRVIYPNESESVGSPIYRYPDSRLSSYNEELRSSAGEPLAFTKENGRLRMLQESAGKPLAFTPEGRMLQESAGEPLAFTKENGRLRMLQESAGKPLAFTKENGRLRMLEESVGRPLAFNEDGTPILSEEEEKALIKKLYPQSPGMKKLPYAGGKYYIYKGEDDMRPKKKTASQLLRDLNRNPVLSEGEERELINELYPQSPQMKKLPQAGGKYYIYKGEDDMRPKKKTASSLLRYLQEVRSKR